MKNWFAPITLTLVLGSTTAQATTNPPITCFSQHSELALIIRPQDSTLEIVIGDFVGDDFHVLNSFRGPQPSAEEWSKMIKDRRAQLHGKNSKKADVQLRGDHGVLRIEERAYYFNRCEWPD